MGQNDDGTDKFSELNLGIRELFRIVIPGAYAVILLEWIGTKRVGEVLGEGGTLQRIAIAVILGLIAYALQVHENWWPYNCVFNRYVSQLSSAIAKAAGAGTRGKTTDYKSVYKYFLETKATDFKDRIHYFSSIYYMLDEMSLISVIAALALLCSFFHDLNPDRPVVTYSIAVALIPQLIQLYFPGTDGKFIWMRRMLAWPSIVAIWLILNYYVSLHLHRLWPRGECFSIDWRFWVLVAIAFLFERLGEKQWKSVINEQKVLVHDRSVAMKNLIDADSSAEPPRHNN